MKPLMPETLAQATPYPIVIRERRRPQSRPLGTAILQVTAVICVFHA